MYPYGLCGNLWMRYRNPKACVLMLTVQQYPCFSTDSLGSPLLNSVLDFKLGYHCTCPCHIHTYLQINTSQGFAALISNSIRAFSVFHETLLPTLWCSQKIPILPFTNRSVKHRGKESPKFSVSFTSTTHTKSVAQDYAVTLQWPLTRESLASKVLKEPQSSLFEATQ